MAGYFSETEPKILEKLGIDSDIWLKTVAQYSESFYSHIGSESQLQAICQGADKKWPAGMRSCQHMISIAITLNIKASISYDCLS
jgi:hypothetical protein